MIDATPEFSGIHENPSPNPASTTKEFLSYIHSFRGIAILFIVIIHATISFKWGDNLIQERFAMVLFTNGTILFVFISGFLFYHLSHIKFSYGTYLKKKFLYVILPYILVSSVAVIDKLYFDQPGDQYWLDQAFADKPVLMKIIILLTTGRQSGVFWFIPMITVFYLLAPAIIGWARTRSFTYLAPVIVLLGFFTFRYGYYANIGLSVIYYLPVYLFGVWICKERELLFARSTVLFYGFLALYILMTVGELTGLLPFDRYAALRDVQYTTYDLNLNKVKLHVLCLVFLLFFYRNPKMRSDGIDKLSDYSFGIFFVHLYIIEVVQLVNDKGWFVLEPLSIIKLILYAAFIVGIAFTIVWTTKRVFGKNSRYLLGS